MSNLYSSTNYKGGNWQPFAASRNVTFEDFDQVASLEASSVSESGEMLRESAPFGFGGVRDDWYGMIKVRGMKYQIPELDLGQSDNVSISSKSFPDPGMMKMSLESVEVNPPPPPVPGMTTIQLGSSTVFIHDQPAARWSPAADVGGCGVRLGDPKAIPTRTVLIGG